ncbi:MAG: 50S ribosomal protein L3 N(5)-glutamine methyltransferase [Pseudomonadales bacterium]
MSKGFRSPAAVEALVRDVASRLEHSSDIYYGHGSNGALTEAWVLVHGLLEQQTSDSINDVFERCVEDRLSRRLSDRVPVAYLTGLAWYFNRWFDVDPGVMIPRSPIGEIVETKLQPWLREPPDRILDLCCGTGCLGVMSALAFPEALVTLIDIDERALLSAKSNILRHGVSDTVEIVQSDLFDQLEPNEYDVIIANPPYVSVDELERLPDEYTYEPRAGLAAGHDGLECWRSILMEIGDWMTPKGILVGETGSATANFLRVFPAYDIFWPVLETSVRQEDGGFGVFVADAETFLR